MLFLIGDEFFLRILIFNQKMQKSLDFGPESYGMNFENMPELKWRWGYPVIMLFMAILGSTMFLYFKRRKWV
jgi:lipopolysaccharide export LptBFGC system permease protein LptF